MHGALQRALHDDGHGLDHGVHGRGARYAVARLGHLAGRRRPALRGWPRRQDSGRSAWQENEHRAYGIEYSDVPGRLARLDEASAVLRGLLGAPRTDFEGRYYHLINASMEPKPLQEHLPLLIGGAGEKVTLWIVAKWADEWNTWGKPEVLQAKGAVLAHHCEALGRDPGTIARSAQVIVNLDRTASSPSRLPSVEVSTAEMQDMLGRYEQAGVHEFIFPRLELRDRQFAPRRHADVAARWGHLVPRKPLLVKALATPAARAPPYVCGPTPPTGSAPPDSAPSPPYFSLAPNISTVPFRRDPSAAQTIW